MPAQVLRGIGGNLQDVAVAELETGSLQMWRGTLRAARFALVKRSRRRVAV